MFMCLNSHVGVVGNKGGVAVGFEVAHTRVCVIGAHLAAHLERVLIRNENYYDIVRGLKVAPNGLDPTSYYEHVFWCGDLNYRIDLPRQKAIDKVNEGDLNFLWEHDQLRTERAAGRCFYGYKEGHITFRPTYRYERGSRVYTPEKMRTPSWCDRVMWKSIRRECQQLAYGCNDDIMTSDHSPVHAAFKIKTNRRPHLQDLRDRDPG